MVLPSVPFTRSQAESLGITRGRLRSLVAAGDVRSVLRSVYVANDSPDSPELRIFALGLVMGHEHVACDRTAAWIHGVDLASMGESAARSRPEVCVLRGADPSERPELRTRTRDLLPTDVMVKGDLLVTTPLRTTLDLGCILRRRDAMAAMDRLCAVEGVSKQALTDELPRYRRRRGVVQLRSLVPLVDPEAESPAESWTRLAIHDAGLPLPVSQWEVWIAGRLVRLDLAYPERLVAVEYDGAEFHTRAADVARDTERRQLLAMAGWQVIVVRRDSLTSYGAPRLWLDELCAALERDPLVLRW